MNSSEFQTVTRTGSVEFTVWPPRKQVCARVYKFHHNFESIVDDGYSFKLTIGPKAGRTTPGTGYHRRHTYSKLRSQTLTLTLALGLILKNRRSRSHLQRLLRQELLEQHQTLHGLIIRDLSHQTYPISKQAFYCLTTQNAKCKTHHMSRPVNSSERQAVGTLGLPRNFAIDAPFDELLGCEGVVSGPVKRAHPGVVPDPVADPVVSTCNEPYM